MGKRLLIVAAGVFALAIGAAARAETLLFSYSEPSGPEFSYEQSSTPTPTAYTTDFANSAPVFDFSDDSLETVIIHAAP